ncbi:MAG: DUF4928 family protein [Sulfuricellaceae bacterium]
MINPYIAQKLSVFRDAMKVCGSEVLAVVIHISRYAKENGLPLDADAPIAEGLGIAQVLAEEGEYTRRKSIGIMRAYVTFLNQLNAQPSTLGKIEAWWMEREREYFSAKPYHLHFDPTKSLQAIIQDLLEQAKKRQQESSGTMHQDTLLQHLVGAKLELALPKLHIQHNGFSVDDAVSDRSGDFVIEDSIIHIIVLPNEAVIRKCQCDIESGAKPIILTIADGVLVAKGLAENAGLSDRIDIIDAVQFLATNMFKLAFFKVSEHLPTLEKLIESYNRIISTNETCLSLRIELVQQRANTDNTA